MHKNLVLLSGLIVSVMGILGATSIYVAKIVSRQGVVTGILYIEIAAGMEGSSIVVDGQVLRQGDTIYGAEVVRIEKFHAEFEKNGVRWKQRVRQKPNPAWEEPD